MKVVYATEGDYVELQDTKNPSIRIGLFPTHEGTDKIKVVEKAKPKTGDVVTGADIKAIQWKAGTTVVSARNPEDVYVLKTDGRWIAAQTGSTDVQFKHFGDSYRCKLLHVA
jgi:hypothetical protein